MRRGRLEAPLEQRGHACHIIPAPLEQRGHALERESVSLERESVPLERELVPLERELISLERELPHKCERLPHKCEGLPHKCEGLRTGRPISLLFDWFFLYIPLLLSYLFSLYSTRIYFLFFSRSKSYHCSTFI